MVIDTMHRCGKYQNSKEIMQDINSMILTKFRMLHTSGESEDLMKAHGFQKYYDQISQGLGNMSLINKPEKPKPAVSKNAKAEHQPGTGSSKKPTSKKPPSKPNT